MKTHRVTMEIQWKYIACPWECYVNIMEINRITIEILWKYIELLWKYSGYVFPGPGKADIGTRQR